MIPTSSSTSQKPRKLGHLGFRSQIYGFVNIYSFDLSLRLCVSSFFPTPNPKKNVQLCYMISPHNLRRDAHMVFPRCGSRIFVRGAQTRFWRHYSVSSCWRGKFEPQNCGVSCGLQPPSLALRSTPEFPVSREAFLH